MARKKISINKNKAEIWSMWLINVLAFSWRSILVLILLAIIFGSAISGEILWIIPISLLISIIPFRFKLNKNGVYGPLGHDTWKKFKYYKLTKNLIEFYDKEGTLKFNITFLSQNNINSTLKKYCKPLPKRFNKPKPEDERARKAVYAFFRLWD